MSIRTLFQKGLIYAGWILMLSVGISGEQKAYAQGEVPGWNAEILQNGIPQDIPGFNFFSKANIFEAVLTDGEGLQKESAWEDENDTLKNRHSVRQHVNKLHAHYTIHTSA